MLWGGLGEAPGAHIGMSGVGHQGLGGAEGPSRRCLPLQAQPEQLLPQHGRRRRCQPWRSLGKPSWSLQRCLSACFRRLEDGTAELRTRMSRLEEELDQERKQHRLLQIKLRNSERAREDAEKRNQLLQREMEEFFSTLGSLTAGAKGAGAPK